MKKIGKIGIVVVLFSLSGCAIITPIMAGVHAGAKALLFSSPGSEPNDSFDSWVDDLKRDFHESWRAMGRDIKKASNTFDRAFLNYSTDDPRL